ncbi:hypothetical protein DP113_21390 [Brasilonema octagenarum UFV-E1]|jgi:hypothetical protein|uniref:Uncharacterized protein n=2 Tax=Brasilonema TaxID=383614 RepID=A0A856MIN6_9CYAN|nr:hypothetical protein [Brasilonema octagenarum UFV-OR1]QDL10119.1 hypothetical protein DP114_21465 [Brasilonema sennae CENA114]QDL16472.1 hypothetical protein DP113_21390 [Brasilonema octagenarum UFV-E1]
MTYTCLDKAITDVRLQYSIPENKDPSPKAEQCLEKPSSWFGSCADLRFYLVLLLLNGKSGEITDSLYTEFKLLIYIHCTEEYT